MKTIDSIPTSKIQRASKLVTTGAKIGVNYLKYYGDKITKTEEIAKARLNENNAEDIYDGLKQLKGSALKVAQMLSMEKSILPQAYVDKFSLAQFSVPPLSAPLVTKTFKNYFGKSPNEIYDKFNPNSVNAASIGQVHLAEKDGKKLAVKIQYPGVAQSIASDLALVKPIAMKMFNIKGKDSDKYFKEVEGKLIEETNYRLEIVQSKEIALACSHISNLKFPNYYEELSSERITAPAVVVARIGKKASLKIKLTSSLLAFSIEFNPKTIFLWSPFNSAPISRARSSRVIPSLEDT